MSIPVLNKLLTDGAGLAANAPIPEIPEGMPERRKKTDRRKRSTA